MATVQLAARPRVEDPPASLSGTITDAGTATPVPGAQVYFPDLHRGAVSDRNGHYAIHDLPTARILVQVSMVGYATLTRMVNLSGAQVLDLSLAASVTEMDEVVVTGTSKATELRKNPVPTTLVGRQFLREDPSSNLFVLLAKVPGVSVATTGPNVAKPYLRGLGGSRTLTLFDGIRQEGQQWGEEHGVEVDKFAVDRVEVVKGPASLMYGSDAMAGVVNLLPAPPVPAGTFNGAALAGYATNNKAVSASVNVDGNNGKYVFGGRASGFMAGNYTNRFDGRVYGTKNQEQDLSAYLGIHRPWGFARLAVSLYDNRQEVPDGSRDSLSRSFTYQVDEADTLRPIAGNSLLNSYRIAPLHQRVQFYRAYATGSVNLGDHRLTAKLGIERSVRREYVHPQHPDVPGLQLGLTTVPFDLKVHLAERGGWETTAGLNGMWQLNDASQGTEFLIPDYRSSDIGPFVHAAKMFGKFALSGGLRYDLRDFHSQAMYTLPDPDTGFDAYVGESTDDPDATAQFNAHHHTFQGVSGSLGTAWSLNERMTLKANIGRGYRAPNAAESAASGVHPGAGLMQLGDADLKPEFNLQEDLGFFHEGTHVSVGLEVFHNRIGNYIYNAKLASVLGGDSLYAQAGEGIPVYKYAQTAARLFGGEISVDVHPHPLDRLHIENTLSLVYGENLGGGGLQPSDSTRYLPMMPPLHTTTEVRYEVPRPMKGSEKLYIKFGVQVFAAQDRYYAAFGTETRTPGYVLLDAGMGFNVVDRSGRVLCTLTLLANNLADIGYQNHLDRLKYLEDDPGNGTGRNGIHGMGRNFSLQVLVPFNLKGRP